MEELPKTTENPPLPKPVEGRQYLDTPHGTTVKEFIESVRAMDKEAFAIVSSDERMIEFAPVVGNEASVQVGAFGPKLKDRYTIHNHPNSGFLSPSDFRVCAGWNQKGSYVVLKSGETILLERNGLSWPDDEEFESALETGLTRGHNHAVGKKPLTRVKLKVKYIRLAFEAAFGDMAPKISLE